MVVPANAGSTVPVIVWLVTFVVPPAVAIAIGVNALIRNSCVVSDNCDVEVAETPLTDPSETTENVAATRLSPP